MTGFLRRHRPSPSFLSSLSWSLMGFLDLVLHLFSVSAVVYLSQGFQLGFEVQVETAVPASTSKQVCSEHMLQMHHVESSAGCRSLVLRVEALARSLSSAELTQISSL